MVVVLSILINLCLYDNQISDISAISGLTNLDALWLNSNQISDISAVAGLTNLATLMNLSFNQISDISAVGGLTNLTSLGLEHNQIEIMNLSGSQLSSLQNFGIEGNPVTNVLLVDATLSQTTFNALMDGGYYTGIAELPGVLTLDLSGVDFWDISDLSTMYGLDDLWKLLLVDAINLPADQVVSLTGELDLLNWLNVTGLWETFDAPSQTSLMGWDAIPGNILIIPEPATLSLLALGGLALLRRRRG